MRWIKWIHPDIADWRIIYIQYSDEGEPLYYYCKNGEKRKSNINDKDIEQVKLGVKYWKEISSEAVPIEIIKQATPVRYYIYKGYKDTMVWKFTDDGGMYIDDYYSTWLVSNNEEEDNLKNYGLADEKEALVLIDKLENKISKVKQFEQFKKGDTWFEHNRTESGSHYYHFIDGKLRACYRIDGNKLFDTLGWKWEQMFSSVCGGFHVIDGKPEVVRKQEELDSGVILKLQDSQLNNWEFSYQKSNPTLLTIQCQRLQYESILCREGVKTLVEFLNKFINYKE